MPIYVDFGDPIGDYCEALSFSFGMGVERVAGGPSYKAQRFDVSFSKEADSLSSDLWLSSANGTTIPSVTVEFWKTDKVWTLMCTMKNVIITSFQRSGGGKSTENISLNFESISFRTFT